VRLPALAAAFLFLLHKTIIMNHVEKYLSPDCRVSAMPLSCVLCQSSLEGKTAGDGSKTGATWQDEGSDSLVW
jgi:hypothetical protein